MQTNSKPGFFVQGRQLFSKDGEAVVLRGINHMFIWTDKSGKSLREIAKTGANCVRLVWNTTGRVSDLDRLIRECIRLNMIPIPELHDATGRWERFGEVMDYWLREETIDMLKRHQEYLLLNVANEPASQVLPSEEFYDTYRLAITRFRAAGLRVPLMLDADGWGHSTDNIMSQGARLLQCDPDHNLLFSIHMWWPSAQHDVNATGYRNVRERVTGVLEKAAEANLPLVVGEFAPMAMGGVGDIPYLHILAECERLDVGWLAWSWGPGNQDCPDMDMTTHSTLNTLKGWGIEVCSGDTNSILNTSRIPAIIANGDYPHEDGSEDCEVVVNGDFSEGTAGWTEKFWDGSARTNVVEGAVHFTISEPGQESWSLQFSRSVALKQGCTYIFTMRAKADAPRTLNVNIKKDSVDYVPYANGRLLDLSTVWQDYGWKFTMKETDDPAAIISFDMGGNASNWDLASVSLVRGMAGERLHRSFHRNVQKNSGYFNAPNNAWELQLYSLDGVLMEVLDKGKGGEGMRPYPKMDRGGVIVLKDA